MPEVFAAEIAADSTQDRALKMLCNPTTAHKMFGASSAEKIDISLIVPDNEILGSVLARKVRRLRRRSGESMALTSNFCQTPEARRFSIVAYQRDNVLNIAGFSTINWSLERDIDVDGPSSDAAPGDFTLCVDLESLFIDAEHRGQGYARALMDASRFWFENFIVELDRRASKRPGKFALSILITADACAGFDPEIARRFVAGVKAGHIALTQKKTMTGFDRISLAADISWEGSELTLA